jgi:hypothetical protein
MTAPSLRSKSHRHLAGAIHFCKKTVAAIRIADPQSDLQPLEIPPIQEKIVPL